MKGPAENGNFDCRQRVDLIRLINALDWAETGSKLNSDLDL